MNNNLDDWLNSSGINEGSREVTIPASSDTIHAIVESHTESPSNSLSEDDLNEILAENGFEPSYVEAEETSEEREEEGEVNTDAYSENGGEGRDLDAEEDADWQEAVDSGSITPVETPPADDQVYLHMPNEEVIAAPVIHEAATQAVEEVEVEVFNEVLQESAPLIPPNSPTLLLNNATSRFSGAEWYGSIQKAKIILAGLGGIGRI